MHIRFADDARADIHSIRDYLHPKNPAACERVLITIFATIDQLENFPFLGRPGRVEDTRELSVTRYPFVIVYTLPDDYHIDIERILHTSRQYPIDE
ncbi:MAG: type II toxin-antitoxin system RelE/ParE family toxin [Pseudomonadota bacterium]